MLGFRSIGRGGRRDGLCGGRRGLVIVDCETGDGGGDCGVGELGGSRPMNRDFSGCLDPDYRQFLETLRVDGNAYSVELAVSDGLSFVLAYEVGSGARASGERPRPPRTCDSGKRNSKESNAGPIGGQIRPLANGKEVGGVLMKCSQRENLIAQGEGSKRKLKVVSTGVNPRHAEKKRASEPGPCSPDMQASKLLGLSFVMAYEVGSGARASGEQPRLPRTRDSGKLNSNGSNAGLVGGQTRPLAMRGSREQTRKEAGGVLMKCSQRENVIAQDEGSKRKLKDLSTVVNPRLAKKRAPEPEPCRPDMQASKLPGLTFVMAYEVRCGASASGEQPRHRRTCDAGKRNSKGSNAGPVGGQTRPLAMRGSQEQNGKEAGGVLMKCSQRENVIAQGDRVPKGSKRKLNDVSTGVKKRASEVGPCRPNMQASKLPALQNFQVGDAVPDENYLIFLNMNGIHNKESSSDSDVLILGYNPPFKHRTQLVVLDDNDEEVSNRSDCPLRKKLLQLLQQPYDKSELKAHMEMFRLRLPKYGRKETRSGHTLKTEVPGHSFEDWHEDLADQIRSSKEEPRTLNLLRGFFFWLNHKAHESMFRPWEDPSCLEVLPADCKVEVKDVQL